MIMTSTSTTVSTPPSTTTTPTTTSPTLYTSSKQTQQTQTSTTEQSNATATEPTTTTATSKSIQTSAHPETSGASGESIAGAVVAVLLIVGAVLLVLYILKRKNLLFWKKRPAAATTAAATAGNGYSNRSKPDENNGRVSHVAKRNDHENGARANPRDNTYKNCQDQRTSSRVYGNLGVDSCAFVPLYANTDELLELAKSESEWKRDVHKPAANHKSKAPNATGNASKASPSVTVDVEYKNAEFRRGKDRARGPTALARKRSNSACDFREKSQVEMAAAARFSVDVEYGNVEVRERDREGGSSLYGNIPRDLQRQPHKPRPAEVTHSESYPEVEYTNTEPEPKWRRLTMEPREGKGEKQGCKKPRNKANDYHNVEIQRRRDEKKGETAAPSFQDDGYDSGSTSVASCSSPEDVYAKVLPKTKNAGRIGPNMDKRTEGKRPNSKADETRVTQATERKDAKKKRQKGQRRQAGGDGGRGDAQTPGNPSPEAQPAPTYHILEPQGERARYSLAKPTLDGVPGVYHVLEAEAGYELSHTPPHTQAQANRTEGVIDGPSKEDYGALNFDKKSNLPVDGAAARKSGGGNQMYCHLNVKGADAYNQITLVKKTEVNDDHPKQKLYH
ncbi:uncharacterized protein [Littorina saxatilis]|uniref:uncharacterized protein n=1 Tax=Littorina saxatilis TaxID=31220 RepID=UPI0038B46421